MHKGVGMKKQETMKALLYEKAGRANAAIRQIPYPVCGDDDIVIKVMSCGICKGAEFEHDRNGTGMAIYPVVPGHEFAGYVYEKGTNVEGFEIGDRVTADNTVFCEHCYYCKNDLYNNCTAYGSLGHNRNGGFAEYVVVKSEKVFRIPDGMSFNAASIVEPVACCIQAMDKLDVKYSEVVVVFGAGPNGMILAELLKHSNATDVVVIGSTQSKLDLLEKYGIKTILMDRNDYSIHETKLREMYPLGVDAIIDATGSVKVIANAFHLLKRGGRLLQYAAIHDGGSLAIDPMFLFVNELKYYASCCQAYKFSRSIDAIANGYVDADGLITHEFDLDHYFDALDLNVRDRTAIKVVVHPNREQD